MTNSDSQWRNTSQRLLPAQRPAPPGSDYDLYPAFHAGAGKISIGFRALAERVAAQRQVIIDGDVGIFWDDLQTRLAAELDALGVTAHWVNVAQALHPPETIEALVAPFLGGDDPIFGTRFTGVLADFFDGEKLRAFRPDPAAEVSVIFGCGAALAGWPGWQVYVDLPKNELQFRARAGSVTNLGSRQAASAKKMYKRFYFVDWPALNRHKSNLLAGLNLLVDGQRPDEPALMSGPDFRAALTELSRNYFRVRPWFEPGAWGGQWLKKNIPQLPQEVPNYAWSFELIVPENGLLFESDNHLLEAAFDWLMIHDHRAVLGRCADRFGLEFPIRFDFLDTFGGGNLSVQCHPRPEFIRTHFGENFTQDETYYILDCAPDAQVYLGFQEDIDPAAFRTALERSFAQSVAVDIPKYVNIQPAHKHDLFLIPSGTVHCSGVNNLVLEISATPYIFTFKMYDWLRLDLDGKPRPLNIERAFQNLNFERRGARASAELVSKPAVIAAGDGGRLVHLPTHPEHFYDVHRFEFDTQVEARTAGSPHVLSLVEGEAVTLETAAGLRRHFHYAETFVVPAAAEGYRLINAGRGPAWVIKAFVKNETAQS